MAFWGGDARPFYESLRGIGQLPEGTFVVDAPCGAGVAFMALSPSQRCAIGAGPIAAHAGANWRRARFLGLGQIEFVQGDAERIPLDNGSVDLFLSYWGLHCMSTVLPCARLPAACGGDVSWSNDLPWPEPTSALDPAAGDPLLGPGGTVE